MGSILVKDFSSIFLALSFCQEMLSIHYNKVNASCYIIFMIQYINKYKITLKSSRPSCSAYVSYYIP